MSYLSLFVNNLLSSPIKKLYETRYVFIGPQDLGLHNIQKVYAIVREGETAITFEVDASNSSNLRGSIVLDTTLASEFMIIGNMQEEACKIPLKAKKQNEIYILDSSSSDEEKHTYYEAKNEKTSSKEDFDLENCRSAMELILNYPTKFRFFAKALNESTRVERVKEIPTDYNGNLIFELPPTKATESSMDGMEQRYDGHCWIKPVTTKITFPATIRRSKCAGHLRCINDHCPYLIVHGKRNKKFMER